MIEKIEIENENILTASFSGNLKLNLDCEKKSGFVKLEAAATLDRIWLRIHADGPEEAVYGGGEQYSYFNLRDRKYPMLSREQAMGRNISIFDENFDFWQKFQFFTKISIFVENFDC